MKKNKISMLEIFKMSLTSPTILPVFFLTKIFFIFLIFIKENNIREKIFYIVFLFPYFLLTLVVIIKYKKKLRYIKREYRMYFIILILIFIGEILELIKILTRII